MLGVLAKGWEWERDTVPSDRVCVGSVIVVKTVRFESLFQLKLDPPRVSFLNKGKRGRQPSTPDVLQN